MKKTVLVTVLAALLLVLLTACTHDGPPDSSLPEPDPHDGVFTSAYGTMTFNGDGESIVFDFSPELAEAAGLPPVSKAVPTCFCFNTENGATIRPRASGSPFRIRLMISSMILP